MTPSAPDGVSLWADGLAPTAGSKPPVKTRLNTFEQADVCIVGGGLTGLWTAHSLTRIDPTVKILVLDANQCGFGASGRNGGWCSALFPTSWDSVADRHGWNAASALARELRDTVTEIERVCRTEGIDAQFARGGTLTLATSPAHLQRVRELTAHDDHLGIGPADSRWLPAEEALRRVRATGMLGAHYTPHCAALHPGRLVAGLAASVRERGVRVVEHTRVTAIEPGRVHTTTSTVAATSILRCTEGYTPQLHGLHRVLLPVYSLMIATAPLTTTQWDEIGLHERETFTDGRHLIIYGQRTADDRLAFGGRGAPYHWGSRINRSFDTDTRVFDALRHTLVELFPCVASTPVTHRWGGPLGVPRDWMSSVAFDPATGVGHAGGYVGDGVAASNLAGRTLADLVTGANTSLVTLPWVGHRSRRWEPEPLRWLGVNAATRIAAGADRRERRTGRPDRVRTRVLSTLFGRH